MTYTDAANTFLELSSAAGEGMWKEESRYFRAKAMCLDQDIGAQAALEDYLISYPAGLYTEQARQFYRTLAL
jgi:TolA-binding protein